MPSLIHPEYNKPKSGYSLLRCSKPSLIPLLENHVSSQRNINNSACNNILRADEKNKKSIPLVEKPAIDIDFAGIKNGISSLPYNLL
jgi:hypothetical protein